MNKPTPSAIVSFESSGSRSVETGAEWLVSLMTGSLALGLCTLAIAVVGVLMLTGRLPVRTGFRTVLGCFVLLGAPVIAAALMAAGHGAGPLTPEIAPVASVPRPDLPPSSYDPYAGASLRQD